MSNGTIGGSAYNPYNWYWLADDGRLFSSASQTQIPTSDQGYTDWVSNGYTATAWPRDNAGNQTDAALQDVLTPYGIYCTQEYAARNQLNLAIDAGFTSAATVSAPNGFPVMTAQYNRTEINIATNRAQLDNQYTTIWFGADGVGYAVTNAEIKSVLATGLSDHMQACYTAYNNAIGGLKSGKITKREQIIALFKTFLDHEPKHW
jgi:hypothetical protein